MALEKNFVPMIIPNGPYKLSTAPLLCFRLSPGPNLEPAKIFFDSEAGARMNVGHNRDFLYFNIVSITLYG